MNKTLVLEIAAKLDGWSGEITRGGEGPSKEKLIRYARELRRAVGEEPLAPEPDKESTQTVEEILERATDKVVDWGQQTALGIAGTADALADRLRDWAEGARRDEQREREAGIR